MATTLSRQALYELVWSQPISKLSSQFGVSDVAIAKACRKIQVPVPPRGWWARKIAGKPSVVQARLGPRPPGLDDEVTIGGGRYAGYSYGPSDEEIRTQPIPPEPMFEEEIDAVRTRVKAMVGKITVPRDLTMPHSIIGRLLADDEKRREQPKASPYAWDKPNFDSPIERRRLRLLSAIFAALGRCCCRVEGRGQDGKIFTITVGHEHLMFGSFVDEPRHGRSGRPAAKSTPRLRLAEGIQYDGTGTPNQTWEDGERTLEAQAADIVVALIVSGEQRHRKRLLGRRQWWIDRKKQLEEQERRRQEEAERQRLERQARLEQERIERLLGEAAALARAQEIRRYVAAVQAASATSSASVSCDEMTAWSAWALAEADRIDPVRNGAFRRPYRERVGA